MILSHQVEQKDVSVFHSLWQRSESFNLKNRCKPTTFYKLQNTVMLLWDPPLSWLSTDTSPKSWENSGRQPWLCVAILRASHQTSWQAVLQPYKLWPSRQVISRAGRWSALPPCIWGYLVLTLAVPAAGCRWKSGRIENNTVQLCYSADSLQWCSSEQSEFHKSTSRWSVCGECECLGKSHSTL